MSKQWIRIKTGEVLMHNEKQGYDECMENSTDLCLDVEYLLLIPEAFALVEIPDRPGDVEVDGVAWTADGTVADATNGYHGAVFAPSGALWATGGRWVFPDQYRWRAVRKEPESVPDDDFNPHGLSADQRSDISHTILDSMAESLDVEPHPESVPDAAQPTCGGSKALGSEMSRVLGVGVTTPDSEERLREPKPYGPPDCKQCGISADGDADGEYLCGDCQEKKGAEPAGDGFRRVELFIEGEGLSAQVCCDPDALLSCSIMDAPSLIAFAGFECSCAEQSSPTRYDGWQNVAPAMAWIRDYGVESVKLLLRDGA